MAIIRSPKDLKSRVAATARRMGTTAWGVDFFDTAENRFAEIAASGKTIPWSGMRVYLDRRASGTRAPRPTARKLPR